MTKEIANRKPERSDELQPYRVRLPGFVTDKELGFGDAIKRAASYVGAQPCGGCEQRRIALNRWMTFGKGRRR